MVAIIVSMHGKAAEQIVKSAEMILGKQDNICWIDFMPHENVETLIEKYNSSFSKLVINDGLLFLVDIWGGSPFNAAVRVSVNFNNYEIISGVNVPMLIEILMIRSDNIKFIELINLIIQTGRESIKSFKVEFNKPLDNKFNISKKDKFIENSRIIGQHMNICLVRIDDRLIHGQVVTDWVKITSVNRIIVVNDELSQDSFRKILLTKIAPSNITVHVIDIEKMARVWNNSKYANDKVMLLFTNPTDILRLIEKKVIIKSVNVGGMAFKHGKTQISDAISVDKKDIESFYKLHNLGIELEARKISNDPKVSILNLISNINV